MFELIVYNVRSFIIILLETGIDTNVHAASKYAQFSEPNLLIFAAYITLGLDLSHLGNKWPQFHTNLVDSVDLGRLRVKDTHTYSQLIQIEQKMEEHKHQHNYDQKQKKEDEKDGRANYEATCAKFYPWKEGHYLGEGSITALEITGDRGILQKDWVKVTFVSGDFGEADCEVAKVSGESRFTVQMRIEIGGKEQVTPMILTDEGKALYFKSWIKTIPMGNLRWVTEEEATAAANEGDPIEAPPSNYKMEPEREGKLVWITGAPGLGKSVP